MIANRTGKDQHVSYYPQGPGEYKEGETLVTPKRDNPSKRKTRKRVSKALKKYVRENAAAGRNLMGRKVTIEEWDGAHHRVFKRTVHYAYDSPIVKDGGRWWHLAVEDGKWVLGPESEQGPTRENPGRKVKGGRAVSLKNFTGRVIRKSNGQVQIIGRGKRA